METNRLSDTETRRKFEELVNDIKVCMMVTNLSARPLSAVPMYAQEVDIHGNIWFLSDSQSDHNEHLLEDSYCQLLFSDAKKNFLSVYGKAEVGFDKDIIHKLYSPMDNAYFDGKDDPRISTIRFLPEQAVYWSTDENQLITLFKMGMAAVTGKKQDIGKSGRINL